MTSSTRYYDLYPHKGRLNLPRTGWCAQSSNGNQDWLKVDLGRTFQICGVATQGRDHNLYDEYVETFKLSFSSDGGGWNDYRSGAIMVRRYPYT